MDEDVQTALLYYQNDYFDDHAEDQMSGHRTNIYQKVLDILESYRKPGLLLDFGCGCGYFLKEAKDRGWDAYGVDPSIKSINIAKSLIGDFVTCGTLDDVPSNKQYDAITLINVMDHMVDAFRQLYKLRDFLAPGGILYLRFPNGSFHSAVMRVSRRLSVNHFMNSFLVFHEYAITAKAIKRCLEDMGFSGIRVLNANLTGGNIYPVGWSSAKIARFFLRGLTWGFFKAIEKLSGERWLWGPSLEVIAIKSVGEREL
jgi:SAM-dependent methyltransferase